MSTLSRELIFLVLQFLDEEGLHKTVHLLESESGYFFNLKYFEEHILQGKWDEVETYLLGFTGLNDNRYSMKIFFEIRKQKFLEALDSGDRHLAVDILAKDLKSFRNNNENLYQELATLVTLDNFRENDKLSNYSDTKSARQVILWELMKLVEANPAFRDKLQFPQLKVSRLRTLINQSLNWQHQFCNEPIPNPEIKTLFVDHSCGGQINKGALQSHLPVNSTLTNSGSALIPGMSNSAMPPHAPGFPQMLQLDDWLSNAAAVAAAQAHASGLPADRNQVSTPASTLATAVLPALKRARAQNTPPTKVDLEAALKRNRGITDRPQVPQKSLSGKDTLPQQVVKTLKQTSPVTAIDFHPSNPSLLLAGLQEGSFICVEVVQAAVLFKQNSSNLKPPSNTADAVTRIRWGPNGSFFGVAYARKRIQVYIINGAEKAPISPQLHMELAAHEGSVNDLVFTNKRQGICVITCGDDGLVKVWDVGTGERLHEFRGHEGPVYSVCPQVKENIKFIFSTSRDGKIKASLYDDPDSQVHYNAPGKWCTSLVYSADHKRLFSCGTCREHESSLVEWNESEGRLLRQYLGYTNQSEALVRLAVSHHGFLCAGNEHRVKFWDMDQVAPVLVLRVNDQLPEHPHVCFNSDSSLLAVTGLHSTIKILANTQVASLFPPDPFAQTGPTGPPQGPPTNLPSLASTSISLSHSAGQPPAGPGGYTSLMSHLNQQHPPGAGLGGGPVFPGATTSRDPGPAGARPGVPGVNGGPTMPPGAGGMPPGVGLLPSVSSATAAVVASKALLPYVSADPPSGTPPPSLHHHPGEGHEAVLPVGGHVGGPPAGGKPAVSGKEGARAPEVAAAAAAAAAEVPPPAAPGGATKESAAATKPGAEPGASTAVIPKKVDVALDLPAPTRPSEDMYTGLSTWSCKITQMLDESDSTPMLQLLYTSTGTSILGLGASGVHKYWKSSETGFKMWHPSSGLSMTNEVKLDSGGSPCMAITKNDAYVLSASGGQVSLYNMRAFKVMTTFMLNPPAANYLAFHPSDNNVIAVGMSDATVHIYNVRLDETETVLRAHNQPITSLVFSKSLSILISAASDGSIYVWDSQMYIQRSTHSLSAVVSREQPLHGHPIMLHLNPQDQKTLLVVHPNQLTLHNTISLARLRGWAPHPQSPYTVLSASFSCNGALIYVAQSDGSLLAFDSDLLTPKYCVNHSLTHPRAGELSTKRQILQMTSHPSDPLKIALSLTDGTVQVLEMSGTGLESETKQAETQKT